MVSSTYAQEDPFANLRETEITTNDVAPKITEAEAKVEMEKVGTDKVKMKVSFDKGELKTKSVTLSVKYPDVVSIKDADIVKGELFDSFTVENDNNVLTFKAESVTAIPAKWTLFEATFDVKAGTVKQEYPFTIDTTTSSLINELNEEVKVATAGVEMVELATATPEVKEVKKETGFAENMAFLALFGFSAMAYLTSRRKKSI